MVNETHKILHDEDIAITPTAVRVPVIRSHAESIYVETAAPLSTKQIKEENGFKRSDILNLKIWMTLWLCQYVLKSLILDQKLYGFMIPKDKNCFIIFQ